jgi:hypothetical protein
MPRIAAALGLHLVEVGRVKERAYGRAIRDPPGES